MPTRKKTARRAPPKASRRRGAHQKPRNKTATRRMVSLWRRLSLLGAVCVVIVMVLYVFSLDFEIRQRFEGRRWALPARVFARPLEIYPGLVLSDTALIEELKLLRYHRQARIDEPGEYRHSKNVIALHTRGFPFWDGVEPQRHVRIQFDGKRVKTIYDPSTHTELELLRLDPVPIASIYPTHNEDRMLIRLADAPPLLIQTLLSVEDRHFYDHHGLDFMALVRALLANIKAGQTVQGGSTLTQQLVKNLFLSNERTLWRKFNEAIMAWLLEWHYSKDEILETYLNEVYIGQDGQRAIHGFGLASQFYFERRLRDLKPEQIALLVAIIKGPSYYDPRRHPQRVKARRDLVLTMLEKQGYLSTEAGDSAKSRPLSVSAKAPSGVTPFPAFVQLVRQQLRRDYRDEDLKSEGLVIFTTLDPLIQIKAEQAVTQQLRKLQGRQERTQRSLQAALVVTDTESGEVLAVVGGRDPRFAGYNRALEAYRPVGSLIKPFIFLTALSQPQHYTLTTPLDDSPFTLRLARDKVWSPQNYDRQNHGQVTLRDALVHSYNVATARLGLKLGLKAVAKNLKKLGLPRDIPLYPSILLGAIELSPFEVSQMYQTLASGGFRAPLKAIREVMNREGVPLQRYPLQLSRPVNPAGVYLLTTALHEVTTRGTGKNLRAWLPEDLRVAGKTGTTDDLRDSWFAGFSGKHVVVVWVGRDDDRPTGLSGATGALTIWGAFMRSISTESLDRPRPSNVERVLIDPGSGLRADEGCEGAQWVAFIKGSEPATVASCARSARATVNRKKHWFEGLFDYD
jgi:penicillin-binding protein 1B